MTNIKTVLKSDSGRPSLASLLEVLADNKGSDLHVQSGEVPIGRFNGELGRFELPALTEAAVLGLAREILGSDEKLLEFQSAKDCDISVAIPHLGKCAAICSVLMSNPHNE